ncbi:MAG: hypothetical protein GX490_05185 [Bacilli bacterium]|nr:hypothetical protein [Bacilli bacterium]
MDDKKRGEKSMTKNMLDILKKDYQYMTKIKENPNTNYEDILKKQMEDSKKTIDKLLKNCSDKGK